MLDDRAKAVQKVGYERRKAAQPALFMWRSARGRARLRGVPFGILPSDIVIPERCPILDVPLVVRTKHAPSLDRIHNHLGYIPSNVRVISAEANRWKSNKDLETVRRLFEYMSQPC